MKILVIGETNVTPYTKAHFEQIKKSFESIIAGPHPSPLLKGEGKLFIVATQDPKKIDLELGSTDIIITSPFHYQLINLKLAQNLKWVHVSSAGVTDIAKFLAPTNILLTNSSGVHPIPISETVLGYMLMFGRRLNIALRNQLINRRWSRDPAQNKGFELKGKTVGIVGMGRIGSEIARLCNAFEMNVVALQHTKEVNKVYKVSKVYKEIGDVLKNSDFVIDCLPLTPETEGYFDMKKFRHMSRGAGSSSAGKPVYFINIGRGKTVIEKDLIDALKNGIISGAGLDVFEIEPLPDSSPLWKMENVILTPHVSGWTPYYTDRVIDIFCENLKSYLKGKPMPTLVDKKRGY